MAKLELTETKPLYRALVDSYWNTMYSALHQVSDYRNKATRVTRDSKYSMRGK